MLNKSGPNFEERQRKQFERMKKRKKGKEKRDMPKNLSLLREGHA